MSAQNTLQAAPKPGRLDIGIIGAGKVGPVLARALAGAGHKIAGINATVGAAQERAQAMLPGAPLLDIETLVRGSALVIFAIPGKQLPALISGLSGLGVWQPGQLVLHTASEHGHSVFAPALASGVIPLALHPIMSFTGTSLDLQRLKESRIAVSAPAAVLPIGQALAVEMGAEPVIVEDKDRAEYADIFAAAKEMTAAIVGQTVSRLQDLGIPESAAVARSALVSSMSEALRLNGADQ